jgi:phosphomevalonate kinase
MLDIETSAPGKVLVSGEYAVLDGAPAVCMAVDRRAHVSISASSNDYHSVLAPGYSETVGRFRADENGLEWIDGEADFSLLAATWRNVAAVPAEYLTIVLDSNEFIDLESANKIGIGSSAALTVALSAALDMLADGDRRVHRIAAAAHREFQGGAGSGADIACSLTGGVVEYRMGDEPDRALRWPNDLAYALLWSGVAADTGEKLRKLAGSDSGSTRAELVDAAGSVAGAWRQNRATEIVNALRSYTAALRQFDVDHDLGIFDAGHAELADSAAAAGVVYKPCGAGGGDLGLAVADDAAAITAFSALAQEHGFKPLRLAIETTGLRREGGQS